MKKRITIRDVAREAGVSHQTVSRAFNDKGEISPETRARVLAVAKEMGYRPNGLARSMITNRTQTVGMVVADITSPFFSLMTQGAEAVSAERGYGFFLINSYREVLDAPKALDTLWDRRVDGLILYASFLSDEQRATYLDRFHNVVFVNYPPTAKPAGNAVTINVDDQEGARLAVSHLIDNGHRKIASMNIPYSSSSGIKRLQGYRLAHTQCNLEIDESLQIQCMPYVKESYQATQQFIKAHPEVTAIVAYNDVAAVGVMQACQDLGRRIPDDIAVTGFDDAPIASIVRPALTTVRIDTDALGAKAMQLLLDMIEEKEPVAAGEHIITPELITRESAP